MEHNIICVQLHTRAHRTPTRNRTVYINSHTHSRSRARTRFIIIIVFRTGKERKNTHDQMVCGGGTTLRGRNYRLSSPPVERARVFITGVRRRPNTRHDERL